MVQYKVLLWYFRPPESYSSTNMSFCDTWRNESTLTTRFQKQSYQNPEHHSPKSKGWRQRSSITSATTWATSGTTDKWICPRDIQSRRTREEKQESSSRCIRQRKKTRNEKKTDKTRDEGNQDSQRRVNSLGIIDPLCQQFGDTDFSTVTARGERGRTRCFHYRWRRF